MRRILLILVVLVCTDLTATETPLPLYKPGHFRYANQTGAYPNPFKGSTTIFYKARFTETISVRLYNNSGALVGDIYHDLVEKDELYRFEIDARYMNPGMYYYTIQGQTSLLQNRLEILP